VVFSIWHTGLIIFLLLPQAFLGEPQLFVTFITSSIKDGQEDLCRATTHFTHITIANTRTGVLASLLPGGIICSLPPRQKQLL